MNREAHQKIQPEHLRRNAFLYVRQSTLRQVRENVESSQRQYGLRDRALALGWPLEQIVVIDCDQGQSAGGAVERAGFQRLVTEVSMNRAGIVMGLEVSRLARNSSDWHRLLEICALTSTLLLDEDGVYDPSHFNDRLLLGLKGTMSEVELHLIRARLRGGLLQKARRGELGGRLPTGLVYGPRGQVELDPDRQIQESFRHLFTAFRQTGSALAVVKTFRQEGLKFPHRVWGGTHDGEVVWHDLPYHRVTWVLACPRYAGAYGFGRTRSLQLPGGVVKRTKKKLAPEEWHAFVPNAHAGFITWEEYQQNQKTLQDNATQYRCQRQRTPPREGPALLQGLALCGRCGRRMQVQYHERRGHLYPDYVCGATASRYGQRQCQRISGRDVDRAIGELVLETITPLNLDVALAIERDLETRLEEVDRLRHQVVERAQQEAELARRRYLRVDPDNRLVADQLEADWNGTLRALQSAQETYDQQTQQEPHSIRAAERETILALAADFPRVWHNPQLPHRERKRMARLLLEDVTLRKDETIIAEIRFKGGALKTLQLPLPLPFCILSRTRPEVVEAIDSLLCDYDYHEVVELLNARGLRSGDGRAFNVGIVGSICQKAGLKTRRERLREQGMLTRKELARTIRVKEGMITEWRREGRISGCRSNYRTEYLYSQLTPKQIAALREEHGHEEATASRARAATA
ncbi:MAG: recombinase family protein [Acidobacteria bacterium]|nr:recombinase family protein [Acidobacteriota bacterium]